MKNLKYIIIVLAGAAMFACDTEYFENPNTPEVAPTYALINRTQKSIMDNTRDQWFMGRSALLWVQYLNQNAYTEEDRYQYRETTNRSGWNALYKNAQDLKDLISFNTDEETKGAMAQFGPNENQIAAARIMLVYVYLHATEVWGDVPYWSYGSDNASFQANQVKGNEIAAPAYADQSDIYVDMLNELKEAQAMIITDEKMIDGDNFFGGDAVKWKKYANSLRLRIANRIKGVYPGAQAQIDEAIAAGVMESNADNAGVKYESNAVNGAPFYRAFVVDAREDFSPSYQFVELLKGLTVDGDLLPYGPDPRLEIFVADNGDGEKVGIPLLGAGDDVTLFDKWSIPGDKVLAADYKEIYMEYAEVCFIMSELNNWDQTWYEKGVQASMERWGVPAAEISAFVANLPAASEETVLTQKYVALFMQPLEAWSEIRRTGYPKTLIMPNQTYPYRDGTGVSVDVTFEPIVDIADIPARAKYLLNEESVNETSVNNAITAMGGNEMNTKMWWMP